MYTNACPEPNFPNWRQSIVKILLFWIECKLLGAAPKSNYGVKCSKKTTTMLKVEKWSNYVSASFNRALMNFQLSQELSNRGNSQNYAEWNKGLFVFATLDKLSSWREPLTCRLVSIMSTPTLSYGNTTRSQASNKPIMLHSTFSLDVSNTELTVKSVKTQLDVSSEPTLRFAYKTCNKDTCSLCISVTTPWLASHYSINVHKFKESPLQVHFLPTSSYVQMDRWKAMHKSPLCMSKGGLKDATDKSKSQTVIEVAGHFSIHLLPRWAMSLSEKKRSNAKKAKYAFLEWGISGGGEAKCTSRYYCKVNNYQSLSWEMDWVV